MIHHLLVIQTMMMTTMMMMIMTMTTMTMKPTMMMTMKITKMKITTIMMMIIITNCGDTPRGRENGRFCIFPTSILFRGSARFFPVPTHILGYRNERSCIFPTSNYITILGNIYHPGISLLSKFTCTICATISYRMLEFHVKITSEIKYKFSSRVEVFSKMSY